jgi:hypothetical protein
MSTKQQVLKIYFSRAAIEAQQLHEQSKTYSRFCCTDSVVLEKWKAVMIAAAKIGKIARVGLKLLQRFQGSSGVAYYVALLDRHQELFRWELSVAKADGYVQHRMYCTKRDMVSEAAALVFDNLNAHALRDMDSVRMLAEALMLHDNLNRQDQPMNASVQVSISAPSVSVDSVGSFMYNAHELLIRYQLRHRACARLLKVVQTPRPEVSSKATAALDIMGLCEACLIAFNRSELCDGEWSASWRSVANELFSQAEAGGALFELGQTKTNRSQANANMSTLRLFQTKCEELRKLFKSTTISADRDGVNTANDLLCRILCSIEHELNSAERELWSSAFVRDPTGAHPVLKESTTDALNALERKLKRCMEVGVDYSPQLEFYIQQAQRVDCSLSPAHALMARCWIGGANQVAQVQTIAYVELKVLDEGDTAVRKNVGTELKQLIKCAVRYAHLAEGLCGIAAGFYRQTQWCEKTGALLAAQAWKLAGDNLVAAANAKYVIICNGTADARDSSQEAQERSAAALERLATRLARTDAPAGSVIAIEAAFKLRAQELAHRESVAAWVSAPADPCAMMYVPFHNSVCGVLECYATALVQQFYPEDGKSEPQLCGEESLLVVLTGAELTIRCSEVVVSSMNWHIESRHAFTTLLNTLNTHLRGIIAVAVGANEFSRTSARRHLRLSYLEVHLAEACAKNEKCRSYILSRAIELIEPLLNAPHAPALSPLQAFHSELSARLALLGGVPPCDNIPVEVSSEVGNSTQKACIERIVEAYEAAERLFRRAADAAAKSASENSRSSEWYTRAAGEKCLYARYLRFQEDLRHDERPETKVTPKLLEVSAFGAKKAAELLQSACAAHEAGHGEAAEVWMKAVECFERREEPVKSVPGNNTHGQRQAIEVVSKAGTYFVNAARALEAGNAHLSRKWRGVATTLRDFVNILGYSFCAGGFATLLSTYSEMKYQAAEKTVRELVAQERAAAAPAPPKEATTALAPSPPSHNAGTAATAPATPTPRTARRGVPAVAPGVTRVSVSAALRTPTGQTTPPVARNSPVSGAGVRVQPRLRTQEARRAVAAGAGKPDPTARR